MRKHIFLLIFAVFLAGAVFAQGTAHPPGVLAMNMSDTLVATLYGDSADGRAVTPDTVLAALPVAELSSFQGVMANYEKTAIQPQSGAIPAINTGQLLGKPAAEETLAKKTIEETDYPLLC